MKKTIKTVLRYLPGFLAGALLLAGTGCSVEPMDPGLAPGSQDRSRMTLGLGVSATEAGIRTRAGADDADLQAAFESSEVQTLWVGVFDVETGNLIGRTNTNPVGGKTTVDILYYDAHPSFRIFGVANYENVMATMDAVKAPLKDLLENLTTVEAFYSIAVDTESADNAQKESGLPLLAGVYTSNGSGFYTVSASSIDNSVKYAPAEYGTEATVTLNDGSVEHMYDRMDYADLKEAIRLRRLLSQVNVKVVAGDGITLSNMSYCVVNLPKETYLQERAAVTSPSSAWEVESPNRADAIEDGYSSFDGGSVSDSDMSFSFFQYENKHWGWNLNDASPYNQREIIRKDTADAPVFTALCGDGENSDQAYNNGASYFEIKVDVANEAKKQTAMGVVYRIHEGYCNNPDGTRSDGKVSDFMCVRNTEYTYTITIKGLDMVDVSVEQDGQSNVVGGEMWQLLGALELDENQTTDSFSTGFEVQEYVYYYANGGEDPIVYGSNKESVLFRLPDFEDLDVEAAWQGAPAESYFTFAGAVISEGMIVSNGATVAFVDNESYPDNAYNPSNYRYDLYILTAGGSRPGGSASYKYVRVTHEPEDKRDPVGELDYLLAFANDWDTKASDKNGAVAGHISAVEIPSVAWEDVQDGVVPEEDVLYDLWIGDVRLLKNASLEELTEANLYELLPSTGSFAALAEPTVKLVAKDTKDRYSDAVAEKTFLVYPTTISWSNFSNTQPVDGNFYGAYGAKAEFDTNGYLNLQLAASNYQSWVNGYVQTGGSDKHCFDINPLYDGVITIIASNTGSSVNRDVDGEENRWKGMVGRYLSVVDGAGNEQISFASRANTTHTPYTFHVKKGDKPIEIWTSKSLNIYSISFTAYADPSYTSTHVWNFRTGDWPNIGDELGRVKTDDNDPGTQTATTIEYDGLRVEVIDTNTQLKFATDGGSTAYPNYFQYANRTQQISFVVDKPGTVSVVASATGSSVQSDRKVVVQVGEDGTTQIEELEAGAIKKKEQKPLTYEVTGITEPTRIYIYMKNGGLNIYSIEYKEN